MGPSLFTSKWSGLVLVLLGAGGAAGERAGTGAKASDLVRQLGSPKYAQRQAAQQRLRELGPKALPAVLAGRRQADLEIARRCAELALVIRADWLKRFQADLLADTTGRRNHDHPIWQRFKRVAGDDRVSRELLSQMIQDDRRARLLEEVEIAPERAGELYQQEVERLSENTQKGVETHFPRRGGLVLGLDDPTPRPAEVAVGFYLGTFPTTARVFAPPRPEREVYGLRPVQESMGLLHNPFQDGVRGLLGPPFKRLFAAWLAQRANPESIFNGLDNARTQKVAEALPVARKIAANDKLHIKCRAATLPVLGMYGGPADERLVSAFLANATVFTEYEHAGRKTITQVRDLALGTLVAMRGRNPGHFGFPSFADQDFGHHTDVYFYPHELGFFDNASREATHRRAKAWLGK
jgi:hypothetical protein